MKITISKNNSKLGTLIPSVSLPPHLTCRVDAPCKRGCYACKGRFNFENVKSCLKENLACYVANPDKYFDTIVNGIANKFTYYRFFRWHVSGDIVDMQYFHGMIQVAKKLQNTKFLVFTKKFEIVNEYLYNHGKIPTNLRIVFSAWDITFEVPNPFNLPVAYVNFKDKDKNPNIPETSIPCIGDCENCLSCWSLVKGQSVVFDEH